MLESRAIERELVAAQPSREATIVMKLLRYGPPGQEQPGLVDADGQIRSLVGVIDDIAGETLSAASLNRLQRVDPQSLETVKQPVRIGPCVGQVGKMMCIGLN